MENSKLSDEPGVASDSKYTKERFSISFLFLIATSFFLSGFAALTYEIVWQRVLVRLLGATTVASAVIVCAFMAGLALGALLGGRLGERRNKLITLAVVEVLIFVCALISTKMCETGTIQQLIDIIQRTAGNADTTSPAAFFLIFSLVVIPTTLMGATFPILAGVVSLVSKKTSTLLLNLYAVNSSGAVFGAFISGFFLLPSLGISKTLIATGCLNVTAAIFALLASQKFGGHGPGSETSTVPSATDEVPPASETSTVPSASDGKTKDRTLFLAYLVFATGAMSFAMEIVWTRFLVLLIGSSTYALSLVLAVYIGGVTTGAWVAMKIAQKTKNKLASISVMLSLASLALALNLHQYQASPAVYLTLKKVLVTIGPTFLNESLCMLILTVFLIYLAATTIGVIFPLAVGTASDYLERKDGKNRTGETLPNRVSIVYFANLTGCMLGAFLTGVVILPVMADSFVSGIEQATFILSCGYMVAAVVTLLVAPKSYPQPEKTGLSYEFKRVTIYCGFNLIVLLTHPQWDAALLSSGLNYVPPDELSSLSVSELTDRLGLKGSFGAGRHLLMYKEGTNSTISVLANEPRNVVYLKSNGKAEAAIPIDWRFPSPDTDLPTQRLLGLLPILKCQGEQLNGLVIGYGSGTTCSAAVSAPWCESLTAVELEKAVWAAEQYFHNQPKTNGSELSKLKRITGDARNFIATTDKTYDFIVSQPAEPWLSGASDLFTVEFYEQSKSRLKNTGMFCQWIPLYGLTPAQLKCLIQTFDSVFPNMDVYHANRAGELILAGSAGDENVRTVIEKRMNEDVVSTMLQSIGLHSLFDLEELTIATCSDSNSPRSTAIQLNTDDNLLVEGALARSMSFADADIERTMHAVFAEKSFSGKIELRNRNDQAISQILAQARSLASKASLTSDIYYAAPTGQVLDQEQFQSLKSQLNSVLNNEKNKTSALYRFALHTGNWSTAANLLNNIPVDSNTTLAEKCDIATGYLLNGERTKAIDLFQSVLSEQAVNARALAGKGLCLWQNSDWKEAAKSLQASLAIDPNQFLARYAYAQALFNLNQQQEALKHMRAAGLLNTASTLPGIFVTAADINNGDLELAQANQHLVMRHETRPPQAIALGFLINLMRGENELAENLRVRYRAITKKDITRDGARELVNEILWKPLQFQGGVNHK